MKLATVTRNFAKYLGAAILAIACTEQDFTQEQAPTSSEPVVSKEGVIPGVAIVEFDEALTSAIEAELAQGAGVTTKSMGSVIDQLGIIQMERVFPFAGEFEPRTRAMGLHHFYKVSYSESTPVTKAMTSLEAVPGVVSVSPSRPIAKRAVFNDPMFPYQWHLVNSQYNNADVNVQDVWKNYTKGSNKVVVCVVDEAVDATHEDLKDNLWKDASGHTGYNYARDNYDLTIRPEGGDGDTGHGTHVAGTISAVNNNNLGLCGIAGGDKAAGVQGVLIMSHCIFSGKKIADDWATYRAIKEGADRGAVISQNSWGYYADTDGDYKVSDEELANYMQVEEAPAMAAAIAYFVENAGCDADGNQRPDSPMKGGLVFFAAGNENIGYDIVGSNDPNIIEVGAFRETGLKASYSNWGDWVHIAAPGGEGDYDYDSIWSTLPTSVETLGYGGRYWAGTSMACPHVSGVAALIVSYFGGPDFTADAAKEILFAGRGDTIGGEKPIGGKINALASFEYGVQHYPTGEVTPLPPVLTLEQDKVTVKAHEQISLHVSATDPNPSIVTVSCTPGSDALVFNPASGEVVITGRNAPAGTYTAVFTAKNAYNLTVEVTLQYTILPNHAPVVTKAQENLVLNGGVTTIAPAFQDEDGETLTLQASSADAGIVQAAASGSQIQLTPVGSGLTMVTVTASDALGASASFSFRVAVRTSSKQIDVYPVPASTVVYFWPASPTEKHLKVTLYSGTGSRVKSAELNAGIFLPAQLDITSLAPGKYTAVLEYDGTSWRETVVKI